MGREFIGELINTQKMQSFCYINDKYVKVELIKATLYKGIVKIYENTMEIM